MQLPMVGAWLVRVHAVRPFSIHSDLYYELHIERTDAPGQILGVRMPQHAMTGAPQPGDELEISFLMGQITAAKKIQGGN